MHTHEQGSRNKRGQDSNFFQLYHLDILSRVYYLAHVKYMRLISALQLTLEQHGLEVCVHLYTNFFQYKVGPLYPWLLHLWI